MSWNDGIEMRHSTSRFPKQQLSSLVRSCCKSRSGGVALIFGLGLPVLLLLIGGSVDYARLVARKSQLQGAADAGVLTGGNALKLAGSDPLTVKSLTERTIQVAARPVDDSAITIDAEILPQNAGVFASVKENVSLYFGGLINQKYRAVAVNARANIVGKMRLCMLTTDPLAMGAISLQADARVTAVNCSLYTNSLNPRAMIGEANAMAEAETICSAGGFDGPRANFKPTPKTGCAIIKDPLSDRGGPSVGPCKNVPAGSDATTYLNNHGFVHDQHHQQVLSPFSQNTYGGTNSSDNNYNIPNKIAYSTTLEPGTYCGGLLITGDAVVTLKPGTYIIKDGPLLVDKRATLNGQGVSIYFTGQAAGLLFNTNTTISLTAPTSGDMAGILISDDKNLTSPVDPALYLNAWNASLGGLDNCPLNGPPVTPTPPPLAQSSLMRMYRIISNNTRQMLGTIHLPGGRLVLDGDRPVADQSNYTVVVAQQVNLYKGPNLVLNANYDRSNVPVPVGVGPLPGQVRLTQ